MTFDRNYYLRPQTVQTDYAMLCYAMLWYGGRREAFYGETEAPRPLYAGGGAAAMGVGVVVGQERRGAMRDCTMVGTVVAGCGERWAAEWLSVWVASSLT